VAWHVELDPDIEIAAVAGCTVMVTPPQRLKDRIAIEAWGKEACEAPCRPKEGPTRKLRTWSSLVTIGTADDPHAMAQLESITQQPLESSPAGMDLDRGLDPPVMRAGEVCVSTTDMSDGHAVDP